MTRIYCRNCKYGNERRFCGKGLRVINGGCSGYVLGRVANITLPTPWIAKGSYLPIHTMDDRRYRLVVDKYSPSATSRALYKIGSFLTRNHDCLIVMRYQCISRRDYNGNLYPVTFAPYPGEGPAHVQKKPYPPVLTGMVLDVIPHDKGQLRISWALTRCNGKYTHSPGSTIWRGPYDVDLPPHYWWLDITAPVDEIIPMHNLIRAVKVASTGEQHGFKTLGETLRRAMILGLEYRGRPLNQWAQAIDRLGMSLYRKGLVPLGSKRRYHRKDYAISLLREWCILNALEGY